MRVVRLPDVRRASRGELEQLLVEGRIFSRLAAQWIAEQWRRNQRGESKATGLPEAW